MNPAILLVDADSTNLKEWKSFLESQNCEVYTAEDSESAVSCCLQMQPDLVLLQDSLPNIRSFELCRQLKKNPLNQLTPVVLLKPSPDQWDIQRGREAGAMDVWATPWTLWAACRLSCASRIIWTSRRGPWCLRWRGPSIRNKP